MKALPPRVLKRFQRLKREEAGHIELKQIRNHYYVYRATSEWDKERRKDMEKEGIDIFDLYKGREDVELAFDAMKNELSQIRRI